jgi:hypothetical protein
MYRSLLVAYQYVADILLLVQRVVNMQDRAARISEEEFDSFLLEATHEDLGTG